MTDAAPTQIKPASCAFVIFGATGDLTHRLVLPSLYNLAATNLLPDKFCVVGITRKGTSSDALRDSRRSRPIRDSSRIPAKAAGPSMRRSTKRCRPRC